MVNYLDLLFERLGNRMDQKEILDFAKLIKLVDKINHEINNNQDNKKEIHQLLQKSLSDRLFLNNIEEQDKRDIFELVNNIAIDSLITHKYQFYGYRLETASKHLEKLAIALLGGHHQILDVCSGEGSFLIEYGKEYPDSKLYGVEIDSKANLNAIVNLELNNLKYELFNEDALELNTLLRNHQKFDCIYSNFPINLISRHQRFDDQGGYLKRYRLNTKNLRTHDWRFVEQIINLMSDQGKAVVVVPLSMLFRESESEIRNQIIEFNLLESVIQLPERMLNYTKIPVALMVLSHNNQEVKFIDATEIMETTLDDKDSQMDLRFIEKLNASENSLIINNHRLQTEHLPWIPRNLLLKSELNFNGRELKTLTSEIFRGVQILKSEYEQLLNPPKNEESMRYKLVLLSSYDETLIAENLITIYTTPHQYDRYLVQNNDILITSRGTLFKMALAQVINEERYVVTGNVAVIRANPKEVNPVYLYLFLKSPIGQKLLESIRQGSTTYILNNKDIESLKIKEPSRSKQDLLAERYLKLLDQKIITENRLKRLDREIETLYDLAGDS
jgi:tRNA1(Val) A37 N6-methylase TrmN6